MTTPANLSEQILAIPNGAGAVGSAGQTFEADPYTGTGRFTMPLETFPGHAGLAPGLGLTYSTHGGSGSAGLGWSLGLSAVERRTDRGLPTFDDLVDTFTLQGDELVAIGGGAYRPRTDEQFARIRHVERNGLDFWVVSHRDGTRVLYGLEPDHRLHDGTGRIAAWYVSKKQDACGNEVVYGYVRDGATRDVRLIETRWAGCYRLRVNHEERPDPIRSARTGFEHVQRHRIASIEAQVAATRTTAFHTHRRYDLRYRISRWTGRSLLAGVTVTGIAPDGASRAMPSLAFGYVDPDLADRRWREVRGTIPGRSLSDADISLVRQSGSGLPDLLETTGTGHWLRENLGEGRFAPPAQVPAPAGARLGEPGTFISDMSGDGFGDLVLAGGARVYRGQARAGWGQPYSSAAAPSIVLDAPDVRTVDLDGDGIPDALHAGTSGWTVYRNLGDGQWLPGSRVEGPVPSLRLDDPRVHLADLSGDGFPDLVFMERGRITVWPGLGLGRFGAPYPLPGAPDFGVTFEPRACRWVDLTGSGQADLLYVRAGTAVACLNLGGVALAAPVVLGQALQSAAGHVEPVDLLGTGATGLLFTDGRGAAGDWRFLEIFVAGAPDLLQTIDNGVGAQTTLAYTSSASHWVADRLHGTPWRTAVPSPQRVLDSVTTLDTVTRLRHGVRYRYHHGVYDGVEREFRGFAGVEQIEQEAPPDDPHPLPPTLTRRWYHTGSPVALGDEFAPLRVAALRDDVPDMPGALRSLRGKPRRMELYALDGDPRPFQIAETAYRVHVLAEPRGGREASFAPLTIRTRVTHTERGGEPRIVDSTTTYDLDEGPGYGLPLEIHEKGFGRPGAFTTEHERTQATDLARATRHTYLHHDEPDGDEVTTARPRYLVGVPHRVERFAIEGDRRVLLGRELRFYDGDPFRGLGYPGSGTVPGVERGRLSATLVLAFDDALLSRVYPDPSGARQAFQTGGHYLAIGSEHYAQTERYRYDTRGMVVGALDPNGNASTIAYDPEWSLFPVLAVDPAGHPTHLTRGEWPFQLLAVDDPNGNRTQFAYDPSGLPSAQAVMGKLLSTGWQGDPPDAPTEEYLYDFSRLPVSVRVRTRQTRAGAAHETVRYVDGLGRAIQERQLAEPDAAAPSRPRWRVSGLQVLNHKSLVVRAYQPYFDATDAHVAGRVTAGAVQTDYDALGRVARVTYPDGTFESTAYHPWIRTAFDRNDNAGHLTSASPRYGPHLAPFAAHLATPTRVYLDALGREVAIAEDNGGGQVHVTRQEYDLADRLLAVRDARARATPTWTFAYDLAGRAIASRHATAIGDRWALTDAAGNAVWSRDATGVEIRREFDALNRPTTEGTREGGRDTLRRAWRYAPYDPTAAAELAAAQAANLFGRVAEERDQDGLRAFEYDWRGLPVRVHHQFWAVEDAAGRPWSDPGSGVWTDGAAWDPAVPTAPRAAITSWLTLPPLPQPDTLTIEHSYDAAGHPLESRYPGGLGVRSAYHQTGALARVDLDRGSGYQLAVDALQYNARGQVARFVHGNGVESTREYDEQTERLLTLVTARAGTAPVRLQDLAFAYDPVGNLLAVTDRLSAPRAAHGQIIPNARAFCYDPRYRLIHATGKAHRSLRARDGDGVIPSPDPNDYEAYGLDYTYDEIGNLLRNGEYGARPLQYKAGRHDLFNGDSDEASAGTDPAAGNFRYDACGNTRHTPRHQEIAYTHDHQVRYVDLRGGGQVRYLRHGDQRVVRIERRGGLATLSVYLGAFEYHLRTGLGGWTKLVLHVGGDGRHAQAEVVLAGADPASIPLLYSHGDHLGSGHILTDDTGAVLSQEEFFPYGRASDRRDARNRYRFIGVERDEATGFCMTGPRCYDPVSARFIQPDPLASAQPARCAYGYVGGRPTMGRDVTGYVEDMTLAAEGNRQLGPSATASAAAGGAAAGGLKFGAETMQGAPLLIYLSGQPILAVQVYLLNGDTPDQLTEMAGKLLYDASQKNETAAQVGAGVGYFGAQVASVFAAPGESAAGAGARLGNMSAVDQAVGGVFDRVALHNIMIWLRQTTATEIRFGAKQSFYAVDENVIYLRESLNDLVQTGISRGTLLEEIKHVLDIHARGLIGSSRSTADVSKEVLAPFYSKAELSKLSDTQLNELLHARTFYDMGADASSPLALFLTQAERDSLTTIGRQLYLGVKSALGR